LFAVLLYLAYPFQLPIFHYIYNGVIEITRTGNSHFIYLNTCCWKKNCPTTTAKTLPLVIVCRLSYVFASSLYHIDIKREQSFYKQMRSFALAVYLVWKHNAADYANYLCVHSNSNIQSVDLSLYTNN